MNEYDKARIDYLKKVGIALDEYMNEIENIKSKEERELLKS